MTSSAAAAQAAIPRVTAASVGDAPEDSPPGAADVRMRSEIMIAVWQAVADGVSSRRRLHAGST